MAPPVIRKRFTAEEYQLMGEAGILSRNDRLELIDGEVVAMTPIGHRHAACVTRATRELVLSVGDRAIVQPQSPIRLDLHNEPQPDVVLLRPRDDFYASRHRAPEDILLVIECADSSLEYDRDVKGPLYAAAGVPEYWLADLTTNVVTRYRSPEQGRYQSVEHLRRGQSIAPTLLPACAIAVDVLLME
jgi:hypothetical protein